MQKERLTAIDIARGIGIILVLYGHGLTGDSYRYVIYSFHMPLFFFLSGIVFHHKKYEHFTTYLKRDIKRIVIPYFLFALISFVIWVVNFGEFDRILSSVQKQVISIFYGNSNNGGLAFNVVLWFLPCLFLTKLGFWFITMLSSRKGIALLLVAFSILGYLLAQMYPQPHLPFGAEIVLTSFVFFGAGYLWHGMRKETKDVLKTHALLLFVFFLLICLVTATISYDLYGKQIDIRLNRLNNYFLFYLGALSGIMGVLLLSSMINKNRLLEYLGKNSIMFFVWHLIVFSYLTKILLEFFSTTTISELRNLYLAPAYTILSIVIIFFLSLVAKKLRFFLKRNNEHHQ